jgi:hypothetical protein
MEKEHEAFGRMEDLSLSQALDKYKVDMEMDSAEFQQFDFQLTEEPIAADNVIQQLEKAATETNATNSRYTFSNDSDIENLLRSTESKNTRRNTNWSVTTFNDWRTVRMEKTGCAIPEPALSQWKWLSKFAVEIRRKDGKPYPQKTLYMLCVGILRYLRENGNHIHFLDEKDSKICEFRRALSARMTELTAQRIGTSVNQAEPVNQQTEDILWEKGLLGNSSSKAILNTMFFYNSKLVGLRGVDEPKNLSVDQFEIEKDQNGTYLQFNGRANKTYKGKTV